MGVQISGKQLKAGSVAEAKLASAFTSELIKRNGTVAFTGDQSMGGFKLTNLAAPVGANDAARKADVDAVAFGLSWKDSVRAASVANVDIASAPAAIDGVTLVNGDRVLLKDQTSALQNGIRVFTAAAAALARAGDADTAAELEGAAVFVEEGSTNADKLYTQTADNFTLETDPVVFVQFASLTDLVAGAGLTKSGNTIDVVALDASILVGANDIKVQMDPAGAVILNAGVGVKANTDNVGIEISANALRIKDDGVTTVKILNANVTEAKLSASVAGAGLTGGAGSPLAVAAANDSVVVAANDIRAAVPYIGTITSGISANKNMTANVTASDGDKATNTTVAATPGGDSYPAVYVNGVKAVVGNDASSGDCYFGQGDTTTARALSAVQTGDTLRWRGSAAGYQLDASDIIDFDYVVA